MADRLVHHERSDTKPPLQFIFTEVWAGLSIVLAIARAVQQVSPKIPWIMDFVIAVGWCASFGLILIAVDCQHIPGSQCAKWRSLEAFCLISGTIWFITALLEIKLIKQKSHHGGSEGTRGLC